MIYGTGAVDNRSRGIEALASRPVRVLLIEDVEDDAILVLRALRAHGFDVTSARVQDRPTLEAEIEREPWDAVISDHSLPRLDAPAALEILRARHPDLPFIVVSGTVSEEMAVRVMKAGAQDFISKQNLARLGPALDRELREAANRRALRASDERLRSLVASIQDVVFGVGPDLRYTSFYGNRVDWVGPSARYVGKTARDFLPPAVADLHEGAYMRALGGEAVVFEWSADTPAGPRQLQTSLASTLTEGPKREVVGITRDVTRQKEMQEQLLLSERLATVGSLTAGLAHEINNPLGALLLNLEMMVDASPQPIEEALADAWEAAKRVRDIVRDVKLFARAADERYGTVDVCALLDSTLRLVVNETRNRARIVKKFALEDCLVQGNESRLGQVFLNLLVNAAHAIPEGATAENAITLDVLRDVDAVTVSISDTGCGMPREVVARLFTPFFTTKAAGGGSGIGLSISKRIVDAMGGEIEVESVVGKGTTFRVKLPKSTSSAPPAQAP